MLTGVYLCITENRDLICSRQVRKHQPLYTRLFVAIIFLLLCEALIHCSPAIAQKTLSRSKSLPSLPAPQGTPKSESFKPSTGILLDPSHTKSTPLKRYQSQKSIEKQQEPSPFTSRHSLASFNSTDSEPDSGYSSLTDTALSTNDFEKHISAGAPPHYSDKYQEPPLSSLGCVSGDPMPVEHAHEFDSIEDSDSSEVHPPLMDDPIPLHEIIARSLDSPPDLSTLSPAIDNSVRSTPCSVLRRRNNSHLEADTISVSSCRPDSPETEVIDQDQWEFTRTDSALSNTIPSTTDIHSLITLDFHKLPLRRQQVAMKAVALWLENEGLDPAPPAHRKNLNACRTHISTTLSKTADFLTTILSWSAFFGCSLVVYHHPAEEIIATVISSPVDCQTAEQVTGRVTSFEMGEMHWFPGVMRVVIMITPPYIQAMAALIAGKLGNRIRRYNQRHICAGEDCLCTDDSDTSRNCVLKHRKTMAFHRQIARLDTEEAEHIHQHFILQGKSAKNKNNVPPVVGIKEVIDKVVLKKDRRFIRHACVLVIVTGVWVVYLIGGPAIDVSFITMTTNASVSMNASSNTSCQEINDTTIAQGSIQSYTPESTAYAISTLTLLGAFHIIPQSISLAQQAVHYLSPSKVLQKTKSAITFICIPFKRCLRRNRGRIET